VTDKLMNLSGNDMAPNIIDIKWHAANGERRRVSNCVHKIIQQSKLPTKSTSNKHDTFG